MATLFLRRGRRIDVRTTLVVGAFALWFASLAGSWLQIVHLPLSIGALVAVWVGVPVVTAAVVLLRESRTPALPVVAGGALAVLGALLLAALLATVPAVGVAIPALVVAAIATHRFPAASLILIFALASAYGSIQAFTGLPPGQLANFVIGGLWVGVAGRALLSRRQIGIRVTPALLLLLGLLGVTLIVVPFSGGFVPALKSFRMSYWHMSVLLLVGYGGFMALRFGRLSKAITVIALAAAGYAALRWAIGHPAGKESALVPSYQVQYNQVGVGEAKVQGSFPDGQELALWIACVVPFLGATAIWSRGWQRRLACLAIPLAAFAMFGSGQRTAVAALVAGLATIVVVDLLSRGYRGPRVAIALGSVVAIIFTAVVVFPLVVNNPDKRQRYENLLHPSQDLSFQERLDKWRQVFADLRGHPLGFGLGTGDISAVPQRLPGLAADNIDSAYLKIAYEQGLAVMALFILALFVLLAELVRFAIWTRAPGRAAFAVAAAGTLVSMMVEFVAGIHIDSFASTTGWIIVGLGVAQYATRRPDAAPRLASPA